MEVNGRNSHCNEKRASQTSTPANLQKKPVENSPSASVFVNHGWSRLSALTLKSEMLRYLNIIQCNVRFRKLAPFVFSSDYAALNMEHI